MLVDNNDVARLDADTRDKLIQKFGDRYDEVVERSARSTKWQTSSTLRETFRRWPKSVVWSVLFSLAIVQIGYDSSILSSFFAQPAFTAKFGTCKLADDGSQDCEITAPWQQGLTNGAWIGGIIGLQLAGSVAERIGHLRLMMISTVLMLSFVFIPFFATSLPIFLVGQILMGIPWGGFQSLASAYASEICPVSLRPLLTTYVNLCWVFGQLLAAGVLRATVVRSDVWAWKIPYALQFFWPFPVFITCIFAPESPWWLTRHGRDEQAYKSLDRILSKQGLSAPEAEELVKDYQAMIQYTEAMEQINENDQALEKKNRYIDCFKGVDLRRTEIACWAWLNPDLQSVQLHNDASRQAASIHLRSGQDFSHLPTDHCQRWLLGCRRGETSFCYLFLRSSADILRKSSSPQGTRSRESNCLCFCVSLTQPTVGKGFRGTFLCHCTDCRTITAAAFANNFTVELSHIQHTRGQTSLKQYGQSTTIASGNSMTNSFCSNCGTLMYRVSSGMPDLAFMRVGTVDDFALHDTVLKPQIEIFAKDRLGWLKPLEGVKQSEAQPAKL